MFRIANHRLNMAMTVHHKKSGLLPLFCAAFLTTVMGRPNDTSLPIEAHNTTEVCHKGRMVFSDCVKIPVLAFFISMIFVAACVSCMAGCCCCRGQGCPGDLVCCPDNRRYDNSHDGKAVQMLQTMLDDERSFRWM